jgi:DNA-binding IclR family transcriptional regulator
MRTLADEFDVVCSAVFREGNEAVVRERSASRSHLGWSISRGTRLPLKPPAGIIFVNWASPADADAWIDEVMPKAPAEFRAEMHKGMAFTRETGFQTVLFSADEVDRSVVWLFDEPRVETPILVAKSLDDDVKYRLASLTAPVFDVQRQIEFVLALTGFGGLYSGAEIRRMGSRLREACDRITEFLAGRQP